jgi:uncharacterized protein (TIGR02001 family)
MKTPLALLLAGAAALAAPLAHANPSFSVSAYSEYEFRGLGQTAHRPAAQATAGYSHESGFYAGAFASNIRWLKELANASGFSSSADIEIDLFGGYKFEPAKGVTVDVGYLRYEYPSSGGFNPKPNTNELYGSVAYGPVTVKYSRAFSDAFGVANSKGSDFIEANLALPVADKITMTAQIGHQTFKNNGPLSYTVFKVGATYDLGGGWTAGGYLKDTNADSALYTVNGKDWGAARVVAFATYAF